MLVLLFLLGLPIVILLIREGWSETYRCPRCSQLSVGRYHRLRCLAVAAQENHRGRHPSEASGEGFRRLASQGNVVMVNLGSVRNYHKKRTLTYIPRLLRPQVTAKSASPAASRHVHASF